MDCIRAGLRQTLPRKDKTTIDFPGHLYYFERAEGEADNAGALLQMGRLIPSRSARAPL